MKSNASESELVQWKKREKWFTVQTSRWCGRRYRWKRHRCGQRRKPLGLHELGVRERLGPLQLSPSFLCEGPFSILFKNNFWNIYLLIELTGNVGWKGRGLPLANVTLFYLGSILLTSSEFIISHIIIWINLKIKSNFRYHLQSHLKIMCLEWYFQVSLSDYWLIFC